MEVTLWTWAIGVSGLLLMGILMVAQVVALLRPRARWTIENVYGGDPTGTDARAYFAFNQGSRTRGRVVVFAPARNRIEICTFRAQS